MNIMRLQIRNLLATAMVAIAMLMASCGADDVDFATPDNTINPDEGVVTPDDSEDGEGYFAIANLELLVDVESEDFDNDDSMDTRASSDEVEASGSYLIYIYKDVIVDGASTSELLYTFTYSEAKAMTSGLKLVVGNYSLQARSCAKEDIPDVAWGDAAEYASNMYTFKIQNGKTTTTLYDDNTNSDISMADIICSIVNVKTSVAMSADLKALFDTSESLTVTLAFGEPTNGVYPIYATYSYDSATNSFVNIDDNSQTVAYFAATSDDNMIIILNGWYDTSAANEATNYSEITWTQTASGISEGQYRMVTINLDHLEEGQTHINFEIREWVASNIIGVQVSNLLATFSTKGEDTIVDPDDYMSDPNSPEVTLTDLVIEDTYIVYPGIFGDDDSYSPNYSLVITPNGDSTVETVSLYVDSTATTYELMTSGTANSEYETYVECSTDENNVLTIDALYAAMEALNERRGEHVMKLTVSDSEGRTSNTRLSFLSTELDPPTIEWDNDFSLTHQISESTTLSVFLTISSSMGLSSMSVSIISDVLTAEELATMNLAQEMDLISPATTLMKENLEELGFPTGDDVLGKTNLELDITEFMPLLASLGKGTTKFIISAGDSIGTCTRTLTVECK